MSEPFVGIVVINYNGRDDTLECLHSIARLRYPNYKVYLVDNGSTEPIAEDIRRLFPKVNFIQSRINLGFTGGNNLGIKAALGDGAEYLLLLNNDTVVREDFLFPLVEAMKDPAIGMVAPKIYFYGSEGIIWAYGAKVDRLFARSPHLGVGQKDSGDFDRPIYVERITGCAMFIRRELIERIGMLDNDFFIYEEELDWCLRARRAGYKLLVVPDSCIWHKGHRDSGRIGRPFIGYLQTRNHFLMLRKNRKYFYFGGFLAVLYAGGVIVKELIKSVGLVVIRGQRKYLLYAASIVKGVLDFLRKRYGRPNFLDN
jgi:hypothetical protein